MSSDFRVSPWAPVNETESDLLAERLNLNGQGLGNIGYGVHATLYFLCLNLLLASRKRTPRSSWGYIAYITLNFVLGTIGNAGNMKVCQLTFIDNRDYPGGPNAYFVDQNSVLINVVGYFVYTFNTWMQDGLLLYRFLIIFGYKYWFAVVPGCLYVISIITSCLLLAQITQPSLTFFSKQSTNFGLIFWSTSIATNVILCVFIVARLLLMRHRIHKATGSTDIGRSYISLSAMFVESACIYVIVAIAFIIPFGKDDPAQNLLLPLLGQVQSIAPLLITLRVAQGRAYDQTKFNAMVSTGLQFSHKHSTNVTGSDTLSTPTYVKMRTRPSSGGSFDTRQVNLDPKISPDGVKV